MMPWLGLFVSIVAQCVSIAALLNAERDIRRLEAERDIRRLGAELNEIEKTRAAVAAEFAAIEDAHYRDRWRG